MVSWARENAQLSGLQDKPIRWIVDDCKKFVEREIRRGNRYDGVVMDPPSYGRGPGGEVWKLEDSIYDLVELCAGVLSDDPLFFLLNSYTTGLSPSVMQYILGVTVGRRYPGKLSSSEIGLPVTKSGFVLPCGSTAIWERRHDAAPQFANVAPSCRYLTFSRRSRHDAAPIREFGSFLAKPNVLAQIACLWLRSFVKALRRGYGAGLKTKLGANCLWIQFTGQQGAGSACAFCFAAFSHWEKGI